MIKGIIFDYGGTIDSRGDHWSEVIFDQYLQMALPVSYDQFREAYITAERALARSRIILPWHNFHDVMLRKTAVQLGYLKAQGILKDIDTDRVQDDLATRCYESAKQAVAEARPILEDLADEFPLALVSNFYGNIDEVLRDFGIRHLFRGIAESAVLGIRKPDPRIFAAGCLILDLDPQDVLVVGDSLSKDIAPAASIGCSTAWICGRQWRGDSIPADAPAPTTLADLRTGLIAKA